MPVSALRTRDTVTSQLKKALPKELTIHGLLAADLALNQPANNREYAAWNRVVPTWEEIQLSMPLTWPASLQSHLPFAAKQLIDKQRKKFERDWGLVSGCFPLAAVKGQGTNDIVLGTSCSRDEYMYNWLLVNTRTFYFVTPRTEKLPKEDHMALQPVADLFNHTDKGGCHVTFDHAGSFSFKTTRAYDKGEEVHISYGSHSNDFLLVEYGFVLPSNSWDEARLDDALVPALSRSQKEDLEDVGFLGDYVLDKDTVCHRTEVAARILLTGRGGERNNTRHGGGSLSMEDWRRFVNGLDDGERSQRRVDTIIVALLKDYLDIVSKQVKAVKRIDFEEEDEEDEKHTDDGTTTDDDKKTASMNESRRELLLRRWSQIEDMVSNTIKRLQ